MGVLPLVFTGGQSRNTLKLDGSEVFDITGLAGGITPRMKVDCTITRANGKKTTLKLVCLIETVDEVTYFQNGGDPSLRLTKPFPGSVIGIKKSITEV